MGLDVALLVAPAHPAEVVAEEVVALSLRNSLVSSRSRPTIFSTAIEVLS